MDADMHVTQCIMTAKQGHAVSMCKMQLQVEAQMRLHVLGTNHSMLDAEQNHGQGLCQLSRSAHGGEP